MSRTSFTILIFCIICLITSSIAATEAEAAASQAAISSYSARMHRYTPENRELIEDSTLDIIPSTAPTRNVSKPPPPPPPTATTITTNTNVARTESLAVGTTEHEGDEGAKKFTAAVDNVSTSTTLFGSSHKGVLPFLVIAICVGFFVASGTTTTAWCHCFENTCIEPNHDDTRQHQLHGSIRKRMNLFHQWISKDEQNSCTGNHSILDLDSSNDIIYEEGIEVDELNHTGSQKKIRFGLRFTGMSRLQKLIGRREKKIQPIEIINSTHVKNDAVLSDMSYIRAESGLEN